MSEWPTKREANDCQWAINEQKAMRQFHPLNITQCCARGTICHATIARCRITGLSFSAVFRILDLTREAEDPRSLRGLEGTPQNQPTSVSIARSLEAAYRSQISFGRTWQNLTSLFSHKKYFGKIGQNLQLQSIGIILRNFRFMLTKIIRFDLYVIFLVIWILSVPQMN